MQDTKKVITIAIYCSTMYVRMNCHLQNERLNAESGVFIALFP